MEVEEVHDIVAAWAERQPFITHISSTGYATVPSNGSKPEGAGRFPSRLMVYSGWTYFVIVTRDGSVLKDRRTHQPEFAMFRAMAVMTLAMVLFSCTNPPAPEPAPEQEGCFKVETGGNKQGRAVVATRCPAGLHGLLGPT